MTGETMLERAIAEYERLLLIPHSSVERLNNQRLMTFLRDYIAERCDMGSEDVQNAFEVAECAPGILDAPIATLRSMVEELDARIAGRAEQPSTPLHGEQG